MSAILEERRKREAAELTSYILHKHYCENDVEALIEMLDEPLTWFGTGENEYGVGRDYVASVFRTFAGMVPKCNLSGEEYDVIQLSPDIYLCSGRLWIETDPSTQVYIRVHQRTTMVFRWHGDKPLCCHITISNPYIEMAPEDVGFPTKMARHSYEYLQEQIEAQKRQIAEQTAELQSIYNTIPCIISRWLRTRDGRYQLLTVNRALTELTGVSEEALLAGQWPIGFCCEVHEEDQTSTQAALANLKHAGDEMFVDFRIKSASGDWVYYNVNLQLVGETEDGQIIQKIGFDITQRVLLENALAELSYTDTLTGLFNRNRFNEVLQAGEAYEMLGVAAFDINGLKPVNDRRGHLAGDELIRRTAHCLNRHFPEKAYRIGGDEFVVIDTSMDEATFRNTVKAAYAEMEQTEIHISVGFSWRDAHCDLKTQIDEADHLMYEDKAAYYRNKANDRRSR